MTEASAGTPCLVLQGISKSFGGVVALEDVDFTLMRGEIHGLVGENGAGKSTLMKIIAGVHANYHGTMTLEGAEVRFRSARDALAAGIGMVHQELCVAPDLTVAENVFLGRPLMKRGVVDWAGMRVAARRQLADLGIDLDPGTVLGSLPLGMQQLVELARVMFSGARVIILDEPTSALSPPEMAQLFTVLRGLRTRGTSVIFISHFLDDVAAVCDTVTVFRNGRRVSSAAIATIDKGWMIARMIGTGREELEESYTGRIQLQGKPGAPVAVAVRNLSHKRAFADISLDLREGEILGVFGFMGCGQIELARAVFGKLRPDSGHLEIGGRPRRLLGTAAAAAAGIAFVPESRRAMLFFSEPLYKNISVTTLRRLAPMWLRPAAERVMAANLLERLGVRPRNTEALVKNLSGGNQQKVALAKWLAFKPKLLVLSEPTRGMDVGAKNDVLHIVKSLRDSGMAILVLSAEPETVLAMADRIVVMKKGRIVRELAEQTVTKEDLLAAA